MVKHITLNTKKLAILIVALNSAGVSTGTLISYLLDLIFGGPNHDWGNAIAKNIRGVVDKIEKDPVGWTMNVTIDVGLLYLLFGIAAYGVKALGGKTSIQIAKGVTWKFL